MGRCKEVGQMRTGSRLVAVLLAAAVWVFAGYTLASRPVAQQANAPSVIDVAASAAAAVVD
jgi:ABC-type anion transport system duplicated permease subunit